MATTFLWRLDGFVGAKLEKAADAVDQFSQRLRRNLEIKLLVQRARRQARLRQARHEVWVQAITCVDRSELLRKTGGKNISEVVKGYGKAKEAEK